MFFDFIMIIFKINAFISKLIVESYHVKINTYSNIQIKIRTTIRNKITAELKLELKLEFQ